MATMIATSLIAPTVSSMIQAVASSLINAVTGKGVTRAGKRQDGGFLPFLAAPLTSEAITGKWVTTAEKEYNNMDHTDKNFNGVFSRNNLPKIKRGTYDINLDDKQSKGTHWVSLFITLILLELNILLMKY